MLTRIAAFINIGLVGRGYPHPAAVENRATCLAPELNRWKMPKSLRRATHVRMRIGWNAPTQFVQSDALPTILKRLQP